MHPLDNPVWHALGGPASNLAAGGSRARRYPLDVAPFAAVPDDPGPAAWAALRELVGPGGGAVLARPEVRPPTGWARIGTWPTLQMLGAAVDGVPNPDVERLGPDDVGAMLALVDAARPGPFGPRTIELGTYLGIRDEGTLVAMAGERMRLPGATEISAVCTHPDARSRGLAARIVRALVAEIRARGELAFLHVVTDNHAAIRVYEQLGFTTRRTLDFGAIQAPDALDGGRSPGS